MIKQENHPEISLNIFLSYQQDVLETKKQVHQLQ